MSRSNAGDTGLTTPQAADAFVSGLSAEAKRAVLASLLRAGVRTDDAPPVSPVADWRTMKVVPPVLSPEQIADDLRAMKERPDDTFDPVEFEEELNRSGQG